MTLQKDQDPGWWRRTMSKRGFVIIISVCVVIIVAALTYAIMSGIPIL